MFNSGKKYIDPSHNASLQDVAPTVLKLMGHDIPADMAGISLIQWERHWTLNLLNEVYAIDTFFFLNEENVFITHAILEYFQAYVIDKFTPKLVILRAMIMVL